MQVVANGRTVELSDGASVEDLLDALDAEAADEALDHDHLDDNELSDER